VSARLPTAWLFTGIPGAGKTTTARTLARSFPRGVHIEGDRLFDLVVSGRVAPGELPVLEADRQIELCIDHQCALARRALEDGFAVTIDFVVADRGRLARYAAGLPGIDLRLVVLVPDPETALARDRDRPEKTVAARWVHLDAQIRKEFEDVGLWIDNAEPSVSDVVARIRAAPKEAFRFDNPQAAR